VIALELTLQEQEQSPPSPSTIESSSNLLQKSPIEAPKQRASVPVEPIPSSPQGTPKEKPIRVPESPQQPASPNIKDKTFLQLNPEQFSLYLKQNGMNDKGSASDIALRCFIVSSFKEKHLDLQQIDSEAIQKSLECLQQRMDKKLKLTDLLFSSEDELQRHLAALSEDDKKSWVRHSFRFPFFFFSFLIFLLLFFIANRLKL
jgi:hypothetical protein